MTILRVHDLSVTLEGQAILRNISFAVEEGENVAVIGPCGSGKTVLLKSLLGILPHQGEVSWGPGVTVGYVPQKIEADRSVPLSARNLLEAKASVIGAPARAIDEAVGRAGLTDEILSVHVGVLSGGQFQRALIAFALLGQPNVLLLDEPTASIDEPGEEQIYELIARLQKEAGIGVVVASHDLSFVDRYANRVLCLNRAALCYGPPCDVLTPELIDRLFGIRPLFHGHHRHRHEHHS
jgi:zinc transport system ATP-binding protein